MKITLNKEYITASQLTTIKEKANDFKATFTEGDLLRMFNEATGADVSGEIIKCTVMAFAANNYIDDASYSVEMIVDSLIAFHRIRFYIDESAGCYAINPAELLITHERYRIA